MRLFVAVDLDEASRQAAVRLATNLARQIEATIRPAPRIGWITGERMHLTLRFIGEVDDQVASDIQRALEPAYPVQSFDLELGGVGMFPPSGSPRVMWIGITRGADSLARVSRLVEDRLAPFGLEKENRPFAAHLTLGRVRERGSAALRALLAGAGFEPRMSRVTHVTLYQSRLSPKGPTYVPIVMSPLSNQV
ncbi:MAG: RNA 2',3'-cyclic phosphodiesterase [Acidobacteria bacterium]|nr:RNA 2',3'-cyclic phosphodiesterase [Acidobacteriota bacterium]